MTTAQEGGKVVILMHQPHLPPGNPPGTHFCWSENVGRFILIKKGGGVTIPWVCQIVQATVSLSAAFIYIHTLREVVVPSVRLFFHDSVIHLQKEHSSTHFSCVHQDELLCRKTSKSLTNPH